MTYISYSQMSNIYNLTKQNNIPYETEDTKQRIKRMKTGTGMTEEEKQSFLTNALTRTLPKSKPKGPPIRQEIPGMDTKSSGGGSTLILIKVANFRIKKTGISTLTKC